MAAQLNPSTQLLAKIKKDKAATGKKVERGLLKAGLMLQRLSQKIVPVDTGALKNSARTTSTGSGFSTTVKVSYGTRYAIYVHEDLTAQHAPGKQAKFLEQPLRQNRRMLLDIVIKEVSK